MGGNAAGPAAAAKAKRTNPDCEVILFEASPFISTGTCELPYVLSGEVEDVNSIVFFDEKSFEEKKGVKVFTQHKVLSINRYDRRILVEDLKTSSQKSFEYDKLILTTGSLARKIPELNKNLKNVFNLKSVGDYLKIKDFLNKNSLKSLAIIGSGYIGLEAAEAFSKLGFDVTLFDIESLPLPGAEPEIRNLIFERINKEVNFIGGQKLRYNIENDRCKSITAGSELIDTDIVLVSIGVKPNTSLAIDAGLKVGDSGGIKVNNKLQTSDPDIYAAGDNIEIKFAIANKHGLLPIATLARDFGHIAGANAAGRNEFVKPVLKNIAVKIFDDIYSSVGLTEAEAKSSPFAIDSVVGIAYNKVHVMPESRKVFGKLVYEKRTGRILGGSFLGGEEVTGYSNLLSGFIKLNGSISQLAETNFNYTPPASPFINILTILAKKALRKL